MIKTIYYSRWAPFSTVEGNNGVVRLHFDYNEKVIGLLKECIHYHQSRNEKHVGGYLDKFQAWFWKEPYLEALATKLDRMGIELKKKPA